MDSLIKEITVELDMEYYVIASVSQVCRKPECNPTKFECVIDHRVAVMVPNILPTIEEDLQEAYKTTEKSIQVNMTYKFRSKAVQTEIKLVNQMTSPLKPNLLSVSISPFKVENSVDTKPWRSSLNKASRKIFLIKDESDSDISYTPSVTRPESSTSTKSLQMKSTSDCSELIEDDKKQGASKILECTLKS